MATENIKKVVVPNAKIPASTTVENSIVFRFRIISEDKNRASHWSPVYILPKN